jgi:hypothetical protein
MCKSMDEQFNTCMAWIWSCMCLTPLCTFTQSSHLKWLSGGGINSPTHPKSHWLKVAQTCTIGWTDAPLFICVGSFGAPPRHVAVANLLTQFIWCFIRWCVGSFDVEDFAAKTFLLANTWSSDEPLLGLLVHLTSSSSLLLLWQFIRCM